MTLEEFKSIINEDARTSAWDCKNSETLEFSAQGLGDNPTDAEWALSQMFNQGERITSVAEWDSMFGGVVFPDMMENYRQKSVFYRIIDICDKIGSAELIAIDSELEDPSYGGFIYKCTLEGASFRLIGTEYCEVLLYAAESDWDNVLEIIYNNLEHLISRLQIPE